MNTGAACPLYEPDQNGIAAAHRKLANRAGRSENALTDRLRPDGVNGRKRTFALRQNDGTIRMTSPADALPPRTRRNARAPLVKRLIASWRDEPAYVVLCAWLGVVFLLGGSSQPTMPFLLSLRPLAVLVLAYALSRMTADHARQNRFLLAMGTAWIALPLLQLVPLPPALWRALPGREMIVLIDREAGLGAPWRPLSMAPETTWNAMWTMLMPFATLLLALQISPERRARLLLPIIVLCGASAVFSVLQIIGSDDNPLYFHTISDRGFPIGLLANRNHHAAMLACLVVAIGTWAALRTSRAEPAGDVRWQWVVPGAGIVALMVLILITQSRSGTVLGLLAVLALPVLIGRLPGHRSPSRRRWIGWALAAGVIALALLASLGDRSTSLNRLTAIDALADRRVDVLPVVLSMTREYAPWGSGIGTFDKVFRMHEPAGQLQPTFMNHVHNDWLELALTGGWPALVLLAMGAVALARRSPRLWKGGDAGQDILLGRLGLAIIVLLGLASITDYPLRAPSLACLATIAVLWLRSAGQDAADHPKYETAPQ